MNEPENEYHLEMLRSIVIRETEQQNSLIGQIVAQSGLTEKDIQKIAYAVGQMIANAQNELGGIPSDCNNLNIIIIENEDESIVARSCDTEEIYQDQGYFDHTIKLLTQEFGRFADEMMRGLNENLKR